VGPVERAVRTKLREGEELLTPGQGRPFVVHRIRTDGIVLLLGDGRWRTLVPWEALEGVPDLLMAEAGSVRAEDSPLTGMRRRCPAT
jgi:hypothetical protein